MTTITFAVSCGHTHTIVLGHGTANELLFKFSDTADEAAAEDWLDVKPTPYSYDHGGRCYCATVDRLNQETAAPKPP